MAYKLIVFAYEDEVNAWAGRRAPHLKQLGDSVLASMTSRVEVKKTKKLTGQRLLGIFWPEDTYREWEKKDPPKESWL
eukprot:8665608-Pyramimonas_sp.AAC.1